MRDLAADPEMLGAGTAILNPGDPVLMALELETPDERVRRQVEMRPVPPKPGATAAFGGYSGAVFVEVNFTLLEEPRISANISFSAHFGADAAENARAADLLHAFAIHER